MLLGLHKLQLRAAHIAMSVWHRSCLQAPTHNSTKPTSRYWKMVKAACYGVTARCTFHVSCCTFHVHEHRSCAHSAQGSMLRLRAAS